MVKRILICLTLIASIFYNNLLPASQEALDKIEEKNKWTLENILYMGRIDITYSDLTYADLKYKNLMYIDFRRSDFRRADLRRSDLRRSDLRRADEVS